MIKRFEVGSKEGKENGIRHLLVVGVEEGDYIRLN